MWSSNLLFFWKSLIRKLSSFVKHLQPPPPQRKGARGVKVENAREGSVPLVSIPELILGGHMLAVVERLASTNYTVPNSNHDWWYAMSISAEYRSQILINNKHHLSHSDASAGRQRVTGAFISICKLLCVAIVCVSSTATRSINPSKYHACPSTCPRQESTLEKPSLRARFELQSANVLNGEGRE